MAKKKFIPLLERMTVSQRRRFADEMNRLRSEHRRRRSRQPRVEIVLCAHQAARMSPEAIAALQRLCACVSKAVDDGWKPGEAKIGGQPRLAQEKP